MPQLLNFGFPKMHKEAGEKRDFCPDFIEGLAKSGAQVVIEHNYGLELGFQETDYMHLYPRVCFSSHSETYQQDYVIVLRYPNEDEICLMKPGSCLISMVHFPTRPGRLANLRLAGIEAISLDSLKDDTGKRLVENLKSVAWNGIKAGISVLSTNYPSPGFHSPKRQPVHVTLLGSGHVAGHVVQAATRYGDERYQEEKIVAGCPGVIVTVVDRDITNHVEIMKNILTQTDLLVDATQRKDVSKPIILNKWISWMPAHSVILDLAVDPYDFSIDPPSVKGIEGIPGGTLDKYIFTPNDPAYRDIPKKIPSRNRRYVISCYSWPGITPKDCMDLYGKQLLPLLQTIIQNNGIHNINMYGTENERAIARAILSNYNSEKFS
jgi:alanine dehydrogenase